MRGDAVVDACEGVGIKDELCMGGVIIDACELA
jgi:hypothetical protein